MKWFLRVAVLQLPLVGSSCDDAETPAEIAPPVVAPAPTVRAEAAAPALSVETPLPADWTPLEEVDGALRLLTDCEGTLALNINGGTLYWGGTEGPITENKAVPGGFDLTYEDTFGGGRNTLTFRWVDEARGVGTWSDAGFSALFVDATKAAAMPPGMDLSACP